MIAGPQFFAEALAEYEAAAAYYEGHQSGLGARFLEEVDKALSTVLEYPETFALVEDAPPRFGLRSVIVRSFPVKLVYRIAQQPPTLQIVAVFHLRRRPAFWLERLLR